MTDWVLGRVLPQLPGPSGGLLEIEDIEDIEGLGRIGDDLRSRLTGLCKAALPEERRDSTERRDIGTGAQELKKFKTSSGGSPAFSLGGKQRGLNDAGR